jgi:transcriptional regulator with XRE-family HTH domain
MHMKAGSALRAWRKRQGKSLRDVAGLVGVSEMTISDWERSQKRPRGENAALIEKLTGGEVAALSWLSAKERRERARAAQRVTAAAEVRS